MKDKKIAKLVAAKLVAPVWNDATDEALTLFIGRVSIPHGVDIISLTEIEGYIRDALKRGTDHWDICSPDKIPAGAHVTGRDENGWPLISTISLPGDVE